jgi:hypothetical protein
MDINEQEINRIDAETQRIYDEEKVNAVRFDNYKRAVGWIVLALGLLVLLAS